MGEVHIARKPLAVVQLSGRPMQITNEWLRANATRNGGYTKAQLELVGVEWPPAKGWKKEVLGREIDGAIASEFEAISQSTFVDA